MVVAGVVDAVPGKEVENAAAVFGKEFAAGATVVADDHVQDIRQRDPLWVYELFIQTALGTCRRKLGGLSCHGIVDAPRSTGDALAVERGATKESAQFAFPKHPPR